MSDNPDKMTDDDHLRFMLSVGDHTILSQLYETKDAWTLGGPLWICKDRPLFKDGAGVHPLCPESHFYVTRFALRPKGAGLLAAKIHGIALWFQKLPQLPTHRLGASRTLSGWVPVEREAELTGWVTFLNSEIRARIAEAGTQATGITDSSKGSGDGGEAARLQGTIAMLHALGIPAPQADTMDDFVTKLGEWSRADAPIDARSKRKP